MSIEQLIVYVLFPVAGYLLGSIPFAFLIGKGKGLDIRTVGSKNVGATNLGRAFGMKFFLLALMLDAGKGFIPVFGVSLFVHGSFGPIQDAFPTWVPLVTGTTALLGHTFPVWLKFKGGKGVATSLGVVLGFWPIYTLAGIGAAVIFVGVALVYRYVSLASIIGVTSFAVLVMVLGMGYWDTKRFHVGMGWGDLGPLVFVAWMFAGLIVLKHRGNIVRLMKGTEPKVGQGRIDKAK